MASHTVLPAIGGALEGMLDELGATTLVLCGVLTSNSLEATARGRAVIPV